MVTSTCSSSTEPCVTYILSTLGLKYFKVPISTVVWNGVLDPLVPKSDLKSIQLANLSFSPVEVVYIGISSYVNVKLLLPIEIVSPIG